MFPNILSGNHVLLHPILKMSLNVISGGQPTDSFFKSIPKELIEASLEDLSLPFHSLTIVTICKTPGLPSPASRIVSAQKYKKYKKFMNTHFLENIALWVPEDVDSAVSTFVERPKLANQYATYYYEQYKYNR